MIIDDHIIQAFLCEKDMGLKDFWLFNHIENGKYQFEEPDPVFINKVSRLHKTIKQEIDQFTPLNAEIFTLLFPNWKTKRQNTNILLVVGCPSPYDAMVREYQGNEYIIFDLIRLCEYDIEDNRIASIVKSIITHECTHICLHDQYPKPSNNDYVELLKYIAFDEGFAHLLAMEGNIRTMDFSGMIESHYQKSFRKLTHALAENDSTRQITFLEEANTGQYWDKYAAICGKLFLASSISHIEEIYSMGIDNYISKMGIEV